MKLAQIEVPAAETIEALHLLVEFLVATFGAAGTILLITGLVGVTFVRSWLKERRLDKLTDAALEEKEKSIQRLSNTEREWRIFFMSSKGLSEEEVRRLINENQDFRTPREAREALERRSDDDDKDVTKSRSRKPRKDR